MGRFDSDSPDSLREAFTTGQVGRYLRDWIVTAVVLAVLAGLFIGFVHLFPQVLGGGKTDLVAATTKMKAMWRGGDQAGAIAYYRKVAAEGDPRAAYAMGVLYETADGRLRDEAAAAQWFQKAAGLPGAERELALLYRQGAGVPKDEAVALKHLRAAAAGGDPNGETDLAQAYDDAALGLPADPAQARAWYARAAVRGSPIAQVNLSDQLYKGAGGAADPLGAYEWASLAAAHSAAGTDVYRVASANAAQARSKLTPAQIAAGDGWVKGWKAEK